MMAVHGRKVLAGLVTVFLIVLVFSSSCPGVRAQAQTAFTSADKFSIPQLNGTVSFAQNGSYSSASLDNGTWIFSDLRFSLTRSAGTLRVSAENSNITILSYGAFNFLGRNPTFRYNAQGDGRQTVNLGLNSTHTHPSEWTIIVRGNVFLAQGEGWSLLPDDTVVLTGLTGNISVTHINFGLSGGGGSNGNLPFYEVHSVIIAVAAVLAVVVAAAVVIKFKVRR